MFVLALELVLADLRARYTHVLLDVAIDSSVARAVSKWRHAEDGADSLRTLLLMHSYRTINTVARL